MAVSLFAWLRRLRGVMAARPPLFPRSSRPPARAARPPAIQPLEGRTLFSAGHPGVVVGEQLLAPRRK